MFVFLHGLHLLSIAVAVGGTIVLRFVVCPMIASDEAGAKTREAILGRWKYVVWTLIVLILLTGVANLDQSARRVGKDLLYWMVFSVKFLLAVLLFAIALMLTMPGESFNKFKQERDKWMHIIAALGVVIIFLSAFLRLSFPGMTE